MGELLLSFIFIVIIFTFLIDKKSVSKIGGDGGDEKVRGAKMHHLPSQVRNRRRKGTF